MRVPLDEVSGGAPAGRPVASQPSVCESIAAELRGVDRLMVEVLRDLGGRGP
jgi:hypothetical protein